MMSQTSCMETFIRSLLSSVPAIRLIPVGHRPSPKKRADIVPLDLVLFYNNNNRLCKNICSILFATRPAYLSGTRYGNKKAGRPHQGVNLPVSQTFYAFREATMATPRINIPPRISLADGTACNKSRAKKIPYTASMPEMMPAVCAFTFF